MLLGVTVVGSLTPTQFPQTVAGLFSFITEFAIPTDTLVSSLAVSGSMLESNSITDIFNVEYFPQQNAPAPLVRDYWDGWPGNFYPGAGTRRIT